MRLFVYLFSFALIWISFASSDSCASPSLNPKPIAIVNGDSISVAMVENQLVSIHSAKAGHGMRDDFNLQSLISRMVNDQLLVQEARMIGLEEEPEVLQLKQDYRRKISCRISGYLKHHAMRPA